MKFAPTIGIAALIAVSGQSHAASACSGAVLSSQDAISLQSRLLDALRHEDRAAWNLAIAPDFRAFERGKQYDGAGFFELIASAHKSGAQLVWSVTQAHVEADCRLAVMAYMNEGSISEHGAQAKPQRWLETVAFRRDGRNWRAILVTSMRADDSSPPGQR